MIKIMKKKNYTLILSISITKIQNEILVSRFQYHNTINNIPRLLWTECCASPYNSQVEALISHVMVFEGGSFMEVTKVK